MNYKEFMNLLIEKKTKGVYLFDSKEEFLNNTIIDEAYLSINVPDFNYVVIKGNTDLEVIKNAYETYPIMEDKKNIIRKNIDLSKNAIKEYVDLLDSLSDDIKKFPDYASLFIFSDNPPFKGKFYKSVQKDGNIVEIDRLNRLELESFIGKRFVRNGKKIQKSLISFIIDRFSYLSRDSNIDLYEITNTVDKIISNSNETIVKEEDVIEQLNEILNLNIFNLTDAISTKDSKKSIEVFLNMKEKGEDLFMIYHMIIRQIRNLLGVKALYTEGYNDTFMMKNLGVSNFELKKLKGFSTNFTLDELMGIQSRLFDMEIRQKSEDFEMDMEILLLISKISDRK